MSRVVLPFLLVVAALFLWAADDVVVFRSDVSLVRVDAQVLDRDNRAVTGLTASDFILREEGKPREIRNFASEDMPVDVVFLLDVSASMRPHVERIASAAHQALRVLTDKDRVAIMVFDRSTRLRLPFRNSRDAVEREMESLLWQETFDGGTDITRGLLDAARYIGREGRRDARRAIVILTDDQTERNRDEAAVSRALTNADSVLSALIAPDAMQYRRRQGGYGGGYPGGGNSGGGYPGGGYPGGGYPGGGGPLGGIILGRRGPYGGRGPVTTGPHTQSAGTSEIARRSGGDSMAVDDAYALENTLARIRQRYALHFYLPEGAKPGQERSIQVELADGARRSHPGAEVRYRQVYVAPNGSSNSGVTGSEPAVITQAPSTATTGRGEAGEEAPPVLRRRPGVSAPDSTRQGPLSAEPGSSDAAPQAQTPPARKGGWRRVDEPAEQPAPPSTPDPEPRKGGWRRVPPGEQP